MGAPQTETPVTLSAEHCDRLRLALDCPEASERELLERVGRMWLAGFLLIPRADLDALILRALLEEEAAGDV